MSTRVTFLRGGRKIEGWVLNMSRGGLRAVVAEEHVDVGAELEMILGDDGVKQMGRIVWTQEEPDGTIAGIEFLEPLPESILAEYGLTRCSEPPPRAGSSPNLVGNVPNLVMPKSLPTGGDDGSSNGNVG